MTRDDIIKMATEAGIHLATDWHWMPIIDLSYAQKFAELVAAAEREECAKVAERFEPDEKTSYVAYASTAIRKRGEQ